MSADHHLRNKYSFYWDAIFAFLFGMAVFLSFGGASILSPSYDGWLTFPDPNTHYVGWQYFRHTPWVQWPIGDNPNFGQGLSGTIVYSDSIPILAIPFKYLSAILPETFQYFGLWILICLFAQCYVSILLLRTAFQVTRPVDVATNNPNGMRSWFDAAEQGQNPGSPIVFSAKCWLGAALITLSPTLLWRLYGHTALLAHWVLLAAILLVVIKHKKELYWAILLVASVLIHGYLFFMTGPIWFVDFCTRLKYDLTQSSSRSVVLARLFKGGLTVFACLFTALSVGYFSVPGRSGQTAGDILFGFYSADLLTLFDSDIVWSRFVTDIPDSIGGDAGFAYLGLGVILLLLANFITALVKKPSTGVNWKPLYPIFFVTFFYVIYAISPSVSFAGEEIAKWKWPSILDPIAVTLRAAGRFIWLPVYVLLIVLLVSLNNKLNARLYIILVACGLGLQIADLSKAMAFFQTRFANVYESPLQAESWKMLSQCHSRVALAPAEFSTPNFMPVARFAAKEKLNLNTAYLARSAPEKLAASKAEVMAELNSNSLRNDTIYFMNNEEMEDFASKNYRERKISIDGFTIIPGNMNWEDCKESR